jgi:N-acetylmuramoyl-L-alanine amidase
MTLRARLVAATAALLAISTVSACTSSGGRTDAASSSTLASTAPATETTTSAPPAPSSTARPRPRKRTHPPAPTHTARPTRTTRPRPVPPGTGPVIVIDPGHAPAVHAIDPNTGLDVSEYENEPEMTDVFAVAQMVRTQLQAAGYRVIFTKPTLRTSVNLAQRAAVANAAHAALAVSIHDQAGSNGGIGFDQGNNVVYYQSVGDYRETPSGKRVVFTNAHVAALSKRYGQIFRSKRNAAQGASIDLRGNVGYDLGSRGLAPGNIWIVQLLSHVPWIYNEAGGNSPGMSGLDAHDKQRYAEGLVTAIEACVPVSR